MPRCQGPAIDMSRPGNEMAVLQFTSARRASSYMEIFAFLLCVFPLSHGHGADPKGRSRAKVVEDYALSAHFDSGVYPQIRSTSYPVAATLFRRATGKAGAMHDAMVEDDSGEEFPPAPGIYTKGNELMERDLIVHGHHPPPPPPLPPPPSALVSPYSLFAIGFIGFLTLLGTLQASLALMTTHKRGGILGVAGKPPGKRKRSAPSTVDGPCSASAIFLSRPRCNLQPEKGKPT